MLEKLSNKFKLSNKNLEAFLRGYILFEVISDSNSERFYTYNSALNKRKEIKGCVLFRGLHIFKGWRVFFTRINTTKPRIKNRIINGDMRVLPRICSSEV